MKVDPRRLAELAQDVFGTSQDLAREWQGAQGSMQVDAAAAGNSEGGAPLVAAHAACADAADVALGRLVATLEQTMDALYACAFDLSATDEAQAGRYQGDLPPFSVLFGVPSDVA